MNSGLVEIVSGVLSLLGVFGLPVAAAAPAITQIIKGITKRKTKRGNI